MITVNKNNVNATYRKFFEEITRWYFEGMEVGKPKSEVRPPSLKLRRVKSREVEGRSSYNTKFHKEHTKEHTKEHKENLCETLRKNSANLCGKTFQRSRPTLVKTEDGKNLEVGSWESEAGSQIVENSLRASVFGLPTLLVILTVLFSACETTIYPELEPAKEIIVVDAWVDQKIERQEIKITRSQPYFEDSYPSKIPNAEVFIEDLDDGTTYEFEEGSSSYFWDPVSEPFGIIGHEYRLTVTVEGETFEAYSRLGRVPPIDSFRFNYKEEDLIVKQDYYMAEFIASDPAGVGDAYWIKAWKNGVYLGKPSELNMAYDAGFSSGQSIDGEVFIIPIRQEFINPFDEDPENDNEYLPPYLVGDSVYVEIHSLDQQAFDFLYGVYFQIDRPGGFAELFAMPLANSLTNLESTNENSTTDIAGFFNIAAVSSAGKKLTQEMADEAKRISE